MNVEHGNMAYEPGKPIPFRKAKRVPGMPLVRPVARIIPAGEVAVSGETAIRVLVFRRRESAA